MTKEIVEPFVGRFPRCMPQYILERQDVLNLTIHTLAQLPLKAHGDHVQVTDWLHVLVCAAAAKMSVHQACHDLEGAPLAKPYLGSWPPNSITWRSSKPFSTPCWLASFPKFGQTGTPRGGRSNRTAVSWGHARRVPAGSLLGQSPTRHLPLFHLCHGRGKSPTQLGGPTGTYVMAHWTGRGWTSHTLSSATEGQVSFDLTVICHNLKGRWENITGGMMVWPPSRRAAATRSCPCCSWE
jgi:hypothetical protein